MLLFGVFPKLIRIWNIVVFFLQDLLHQFCFFWKSHRGYYANMAVFLMLVVWLKYVLIFSFQVSHVERATIYYANWTFCAMCHRRVYEVQFGRSCHFLPFFQLSNLWSWVNLVKTLNSTYLVTFVFVTQKAIIFLNLLLCSWRGNA